MKKLIVLISLLLFIPNVGFAKAYKVYVAHYWTAFAIEKDEGNGGPSYYKHYVTKAFNNKSIVFIILSNITETQKWKSDTQFMALYIKFGLWDAIKNDKRYKI